MKVRIAKEQKIKVLNSDDLYSIMKKVFLRLDKIRRRKEYFWIAGLETNNKISFIELIAIGSVNWIQIEPREIFRIAVIKNVPKVILIHNHPSGEVIPSTQDKELTKKLIKSGKLLGIDVIDPLIITTESFMSFSDEDFIE